MVRVQYIRQNDIREKYGGIYLYLYYSITPKGEVEPCCQFLWYNTQRRGWNHVVSFFYGVFLGDQFNYFKLDFDYW